MTGDLVYLMAASGIVMLVLAVGGWICDRLGEPERYDSKRRNGR